MPLLSLASFAGLIVLVALGTWQLQRRAEKFELIARIESRTTAPPVELPPPGAWPGLDLDDWEYRRVTARGTFDHAAEALIFTSLGEPRGPAGGPGYWVVTPLRLNEGGIVLVNRGFVPQSHKSRETRAEGETRGPIEVTGLVRSPEEPGWFSPPADMDAGIWFVRDIRSIAAARGLERIAPLMIDAEASPSGGLPQAGETRLVFRNQHLGYALTWYGLAAALLLVYLAFHVSRGRLRIGRE